MNLSFKLISARQELADYQQQILVLFEECFAKPFNEKLWRWAYLDNPCGQPIVSLCFNAENKLVGHYAAIPIFLRNQSGPVNTLLSVTTMVHIKYRQFGVFIKQANQVYEEAKKRGVELVVGFPNKNAIPGRKKRLGWKIAESDYIASVNREQLVKSRALKDTLENLDLFDLDIDDKRYRQWRLAKPGAEYIDRGEVVLKKFKQSYDLVYLGKCFSAALIDGEKYNILIDGSNNDFRGNFLSDYQFGYKVLANDLVEPKFKKNMLMSDVF